MANVYLRSSTDLRRNTLFRSSEHRTVTSYERELTTHRCTEIWLREALAREEALLRQKDELIQQLEVLSAESDRRLLNGLQMIGSLLSLQSRASANAAAASQLAIAADRVATVGRVHWRLHSIDGVQTVAFKQYLEDLCRDFSMMLSSEDRPDRRGDRNQAADRDRRTARLHRQRTDHERRQVRRRPDHGRAGSHSWKRLRAVGVR